MPHRNPLVPIILAIILLTSSHQLFSQWAPAGDHIKTRWASEINPENVHQEYPRPMMQRAAWMNLNGLWDFAMTPRGAAMPEDMDSQILVPFPVESSLSGIMKEVGPAREVWYSREFTVPSAWKGQQILLHFGAVDWRADVFVNSVKIGSHEGGYDPFYFDITPFLSRGPQQLTVKVWDPTEKGPQARGKQTSRPGGIWYTPVTGIWQTVWLEPVPEKSLESLRITPDVDNNVIRLTASTRGTSAGDLVRATVTENGKQTGTASAAAGQELTIAVPEARLWSPEDPYLYDLKVELVSGGKVTDETKSYFAMRKISTGQDENGIRRIFLNNKPYFQFGTLDQGWWPDGLYTAPSDEALRYDIEKTKKYGFNMIRKHVKTEPARWYMHCDRIGMLVWQDMPNGDETHLWQRTKYYDGKELERTGTSENIYRKEWKAIMDYLYSYPSIVTWVPFNEGWGQFKTREIADWTKTYDPSRLVNPASGGNHFPVGDMLDLHNYPEPSLYLYDAMRPTILGEYGGIGLVVEGHVWEPDRNWGYVQYKTTEKATDAYVEYAEMLADLVRRGFSAAIYTQTTDVEMEVNGLMTYDREIDKLDMERVRKVNEKVISALPSE